MKFIVTICITCIIFLSSAFSQKTVIESFPCNRTWDVLNKPSKKTNYRKRIKQAGELLGPWFITVGSVYFSGHHLKKFASIKKKLPFIRVLRESLQRPVDVEDFLFFLDDLIHQGNLGLRGQEVYISNSSARAHGIFIHPVDIFTKESRKYCQKYSEVNILKPVIPHNLLPAEDNDPLGPNWTARYKNPRTTHQKLHSLSQKLPDSSLADRIKSLMRQLKRQGASVQLSSTLRSPKRGYLMWGAFRLSHATSEKQVITTINDLRECNRTWHLNVPITWQHPQGWQETITAATAMAKSYNVVYATRTGARNSNHYQGSAVDLSVVGLPAKVRLTAPDGIRKTFNLSRPYETRDLSLTPKMITWIEEHFHLKKLKMDYPHWDDAATELLGVNDDENL